MNKYSFTNNGKTPTAYTLGTVKQYDYSVMEG